MKIQYGHYPTQDSGVQTVTLPISFDSTTYNVVCVRKGTGSPTNTQIATIIVYGQSVSKSSFNLYFSYSTSANWIAIGY